MNAISRYDSIVDFVTFAAFYLGAALSTGYLAGGIVHCTEIESSQLIPRAFGYTHMESIDRFQLIPFLLFAALTMIMLMVLCTSEVTKFNYLHTCISAMLFAVGAFSLGFFLAAKMEEHHHHIYGLQIISIAASVPAFVPMVMAYHWYGENILQSFPSRTYGFAGLFVLFIAIILSHSSEDSL